MGIYITSVKMNLTAVCNSQTETILYVKFKSDFINFLHKGVTKQKLAYNIKHGALYSLQPILITFFDLVNI
jgi:hypothetical protein